MNDKKANWQKSLYAIFAAETIAIAGFSVSMPLLPFFMQELGVTDPTGIKLWVGACNTAGEPMIGGIVADLSGPMVGASVSVIWGYRGVFIATSLILFITAFVLVSARSTKPNSNGG